MKLRPYQKDAVKALRENKKGIIAAATGSGKTTMMAASIKEKAMSGKILVLVHLQDLVIQTVKRTKSETGLKVVQFYGEVKDDFSEADVVIATWQSLQKVIESNKISPNFFYSINVDEAHYIRGQQYRTVVEYFNPVFLHGFTATPYGPGEEIIFEVFGGILFEIDIFSLIELGFLTKLHVKVFKSNYSKIDPVLIDGYYQKKQEHIKETEKQLRMEKRPVKILHFFKNNNHIAEYSFFNSSNKSAIYSSIKNRKARNNILADFKSEYGKIRHLYSIRMLNEGVDIPIINGLVFHENAGNLRTFSQRLGRGLRVYDNPEQITYVTQFLDFKDKESAQSIISLKAECDRAKLNRGENKEYDDFVQFELDQESEEFLDSFRNELEDKRNQSQTVKMKCAKCGSDIHATKTTADLLHNGDAFLCSKCFPGGGIQSSCAECGKPIQIKPAKYRLNLNHNTKFYCSAHSKKHKPEVSVTCAHCKKEFSMKAGIYNGRVRNGQSVFYCSKKCRTESKKRYATCSVCGREFEISIKHYNQKMKIGGRFYCPEHTIKKTKKAQSTELISA